MIKQIRTEKFEGLAVLMPTTFHKIHSLHSDRIYFEYIFEGYECLDFIKIPYPCETLGKSTDITEEQCAEILEIACIEGSNLTFYNLYNTGSTVTFKSKESLASLLQSLGFKEADNIVILRKL